MTNVIHLPSSAERGWAQMEKQVREAVARGGATPEVAAEILLNIKPLIDILWGPFTLSIEGPPAVVQLFETNKQALTDALAERSERILVERLKRELDACSQSGLLR